MDILEQLVHLRKELLRQVGEYTEELAYQKTQDNESLFQFYYSVREEKILELEKVKATIKKYTKVVAESEKAIASAKREVKQTLHGIIFKQELF